MKISPSKKYLQYQVLIFALAIFSFGFLLISALIGSRQIAFPVALLIAGTPFLFHEQRLDSQRREFESLWPEILDLIISGIHSGLPLSHTLTSLADRGPRLTRENFQRFSENVKSGISFETSLSYLKREFAHPLSDQVCEVLRISQSSGSRDTALTLRTYAEFVTSDLALNNEIRAKHSWIRNSALLASITPWFLLLLLASQESARRAYSTPSGFLVLMAGVSLTIVAYFWMNKVGKISSAPRVLST
jgi:tight adherence protein B